ncbi:MAG: hypothetical protein ACE5GW_07185 [Planctomycetota bacterium]
MERLVLQNGTAELHIPGSSAQSMPSRAVIEAVRKHSVHGLEEEPLPHGVRWRVRCGPTTIFIFEMEPCLRRISWLRPDSPFPFGGRALYADFRVATPLVVLKVPFRDGKIQPRCELFYRNTPLEGLESKLYWSNLLNVSPNSFAVTAWVCTQFLGAELKKARAKSGKPLTVNRQIDLFVEHLWGGSFNLSSEIHEGTSCFSKAVKDKVDPRVTDIERWQAASVEDWRFILGVKWKRTPLTVGSLIDKELAFYEQPLDLADTSELTNVILAENPGKGG